VVEELKREIEAINPLIQVRLGDEMTFGNPRLLDSSRFCGEFGFESRPFFAVLRGEADETSA
jgi:hypothetical protein